MTDIIDTQRKTYINCWKQKYYIQIAETYKNSTRYQFSSVTQSCPTLCDPMDCSTPSFPVHHRLPEFIQTHVHQVGDAIQPSHPLLSSSPPAFNLSQHQGLFKWVSCSQYSKALEFRLQHQCFQWIPRTDFLNTVGLISLGLKGDQTS